MRPPHPNPYRREIIGAYVLAVFSVTGVVFSLYLTILKFRAEFTCEPTLLATCSGGCELALSDSISAPIWDLPITVYGTSAFLVLFTIAIVGLIVPHRALRPSRLTALVFTWVGVTCSVALGLYALFGLGELCVLCAVLYCACVGALLGAWMISPRGPVSGLLAEASAVFRTRGRNRAALLPWVVLGVAGSGFFLATSAQNLKYKQEVFESRRQTPLSCRERMSTAFPPTSVVVPSTSKPKVVVGLFVDLACPHCSEKYKVWSEIQAAYSEDVELRVFHFPMDTRCYTWGNALGSESNSCFGAASLECLADGMTSGHAQLLTAFFDLQSGEGVYFEEGKIQALAESLGIADLDCTAASSEYDERVAHHIAFAEHLGFRSPPSTVIARAGGRGFTEMISLEGGARDRRFLESMVVDFLGEGRRAGHEVE